MKLNLDKIEKHPILSPDTVDRLSRHKLFLAREMENFKKRIERINRILEKV